MQSQYTLTSSLSAQIQKYPFQETSIESCTETFRKKLNTASLTKIFSFNSNRSQTLSCVLQRFSISLCLVARGESFHWLSLFFRSSTVLKTIHSVWLLWQRGLPIAMCKALIYLAKERGKIEKRRGEKLIIFIEVTHHHKTNKLLLQMQIEHLQCAFKYPI